MDIPSTSRALPSPGVYTEDADGNMKLVHAYQGGDYGLEDISDNFQLGRLELPLQGDETVLSLDAAELRRLKTMADAYSFDYEEGVDSRLANQEIIEELLRRGAIRDGDLVIITKGDLTGVSGGTNVMKILRVGEHILPD